MVDNFALLNEKLGGEEAEAKVKERISSFHGLLTKEAAAKLIAAEMGLIERETLKLSELKEGLGDIDLDGRIEEIGKLRSFPSGAVLRNVVISDESGEATVNFWGDEAKKAGRMHILDKLEIRKGYVKMGKVNIGYKSAYRVAESAEILSVDMVEAKNPGERFLTMGKVELIEGKTDDAFVFVISGEGKSVPVRLVNSPSKGEHLKVGDSVLLEGVTKQETGDGKPEIVVERRARMLLRKNRDNIFRGNLEGIELDGESIVLSASGEKFRIDKETLVRFLKLKDLNEDIDLNGLLEMKVPEIKGKSVYIVFKNSGDIKEVEKAELR